MAWKRKQATGNALFSSEERVHFQFSQRLNAICLGGLFGALTIKCCLLYDK